MKYLKKFNDHNEEYDYVNSNKVIPSVYACVENHHVHYNDFENFENGYEWVDLGLPSGTLWAKVNIGADYEYEYGDYFSWGETRAKKTYLPETYKFNGTTVSVFYYQLVPTTFNVYYYNTNNPLHEEDIPAGETSVKIVSYTDISDRSAFDANEVWGLLQANCSQTELWDRYTTPYYKYLGYVTYNPQIQADETIYYERIDDGVSTYEYDLHNPILEADLPAGVDPATIQKYPMGAVPTCPAPTSASPEYIGQYYDMPTKYNNVDGKMVLDLEDDAANIIWGGKWMMPEAWQLVELMRNTEWEWTRIGGIDGMKFKRIYGTGDTETEKEEWDTLDYIFLPANGVMYQYFNYNSGFDVNIWSSTRSDAIDMEDYAAGMAARSQREGATVEDPDYQVPIAWGSDNARFYGFAIRPVINSHPKPKYENGYECVDLGLPSGTLWAKMNVGAPTEGDYGTYYQWGGTESSQGSFTFDDCVWYDSATSEFTKYCAADGKTTLDLEDDPAHLEMGGRWMMPTSTQIVELIQNTDNFWTEFEYQDEWGFTRTCTGRKFVNRDDNEKYIFIPASGVNGGRWFATTNINLWSRNLTRGNVEKASGMASTRTNANGNDNERFYSFTVRGVVNPQ